MPGTPDALPLRRRIAPLVVLFLLAPWVGEYLLANIPLARLRALPFLAPMYGGGEILVREAALRIGIGWPGNLLLGLAYGVIEAALVDQSLFNPGFMGQDFPRATPVPALGISTTGTVAFLAGHAVWSIALPIRSLSPAMRGLPRRRRD